MTNTAAFVIPPAALDQWRHLCAVLADLAGSGATTPCQGEHASWWTSSDAEEREAAGWRCAPCDALAQCGAYADAANERFGVWAGLDRNPARKEAAA